MSSDSTLPTSLERLPVEIFLQIFAFLPLQELVKTFFGLNSNINSIIQSSDSKLSHVISYGDADAINLLYLFAIQIKRLVIIRTGKVDFNSLINLGSLTLRYGTRAQYDSIRPQHFPKLEILHIYAGESHKS
jgi:hypothetical protein